MFSATMRFNYSWMDKLMYFSRLAGLCQNEQSCKAILFYRWGGSARANPSWTIQIQEKDGDVKSHSLLWVWVKYLALAKQDFKNRGTNCVDNLPFKCVCRGEGGTCVCKWACSCSQSHYNCVYGGMKKIKNSERRNNTWTVGSQYCFV